jgi:hypothetical protein
MWKNPESILTINVEELQMCITDNWFIGTKIVARFFSTIYTKTGGNIPKNLTFTKMAIKYSKG